ncbi:MAG: DUF1156 domain-containing protein [Anaerolineales bacterium]|nr:DUF1156 domain-containing protein [Anaerolineales bacterium]
MPVPDFNDPNRPPVCLEVDFPIAPINALSNLEGNAGKPIYQMSKWWARRRSSVFRSLLIAAATQAPEDPTKAGKLVWDHYYANHQKAGSFKKLRVLEPFMGGGTTMVEGARLGFQMTGIDLNPVAWFVTKNELACSDPKQVQAFFDHIEREVKPLIQPFYTTTCPRGHQGQWIDLETDLPADVDPLTLPPEDRKRYRWYGPEIIYTFWAKHGPCKADGHRTPLFKSPVVAEKKLTTAFIPTSCPDCGRAFHIELGETRMAPGVERVVLDNEPSFTETTQAFAQLLKDYSKGSSAEKTARINELIETIDDEPGLRCPHCGAFAGRRIKQVAEKHKKVQRQSDIKKGDYGIETRHVYMYLLIHPDWLRGTPGELDGQPLGGWAGADPDSTARWYSARMEGLRLIEVRGRIKLADETTPDDEDTDAGEEGASEADGDDRKGYGLPREIVLSDGSRITTRIGTIPAKAAFACQSCGRQQDVLEAVKASNHTGAMAVYALQCHCPQCALEGYNYTGRYFKAPDDSDVEKLIAAETEWATRNIADLESYFPHPALPYAWKTSHWDIQGHGYTHWWKMFNSRQLLVHAQLLRAITNGGGDWALDVREQALGAFQQYLRNQNMFVFWNTQRDTPEPMFSNPNYHPKQQVLENSVWGYLGRGNWLSCVQACIEGLEWSSEAWEVAFDNSRTSHRILTDDPVPFAVSTLYCQSSTDLADLATRGLVDLVVTDPPFGDNINYADLADFFYVWLRIPLQKWYAGLSEAEYFKPEFTPKSIEAIENWAEHPDDRTPEEKRPLLEDKTPNSAFRLPPAEEFYQNALMECWYQAGKLLKPGGLMAFTFHHDEDRAWANVLAALFQAGFVLVATYPIRSDETKGDKAQFGSQKIEYDIIHVCRKRLDDPQPVSYAGMRRWVKDEVNRLKLLLEHTHGKTLPDSDLRVILRGKALEFYSRHYGQVLTGDRQALGVRDALLGINQLLDDLLEQGTVRRPPENAEPMSRLYLRIFQSRSAMSRDELHKTLRGTGVSQDALEAAGWIEARGTTIEAKPIRERFAFFTAPGRNRKVLKTDLDQAHFLIGAALPGSGIDITKELSNRETFKLKKSVDAILTWYSQVDPNASIREAAGRALALVGHWRAEQAKTPETMQLSLFEQLDMEDN